MGYNDFLLLLKQNTSNKLDGYKELCLICLENRPNGVDISENSCSSIKRREAIRSNYTIITKKYLPTSDEYPKFVCPACERNLSQFAVFAQQIEESAENWEIFLTNERTDEPTDVVDVFKIEFCDEKCDNGLDNGPDTDTHIPHAWELPPLKIEEVEEVNTESLGELLPQPVKRIKKTTRTRKMSSLKTSTEFERTCKHCDAPTFSSLERMYGHQRSMHRGLKIFSCDHCGATFISKDSLIRHMKDRHSNCGRKHQCQFCAKLFYSDREVKGHEKLHLNARSYVCNLCGKGFNQKTDLNAHLRSKAHNSNYKKPKQYPLNKKVYRCIQCVPATVYPSAEERTNHRNIMHKIYECDICKNSFLTLESLISHTRLHSSKPRPHVCSICNATFNQSSHLSSHFKCKHTERKSHQCTICDKAFSENFQLNQHMNLVHRKQQRAKCNECESDFATKKYLRKHILERHSTKASPYDCKDCDIKIGSGEKLALHRLKHHREDDGKRTSLNRVNSLY